jgi:hypothetical protein
LQKLNEDGLTMIKMLILTVLILFINLKIAFTQVNDQEFMLLLKIAIKNYEIEALIKDHASWCISQHTKNDRFIIKDDIPYNLESIKYNNKTIKFISLDNAFYCQLAKYGTIENYHIGIDNAFLVIKFFDWNRILKGEELLIGKFYFEKKKKWKLKNITISK